MKKIIFTFLILITALITVNAQKDINFKLSYPAGGKLLMNVDSSAKKVYYNNVFPNQPKISFNYLPDANNVNLQIYFRKNIAIKDFRYTILMDDKPINVNQSFNLAQMKDANAGDEEVFSSASLGVFPIKDKIITVLLYSIEKPQDIDKTVFYGKPIPKAKIKSFSKRFETEKGVDYSWVTEPKDTTNFTFNEKDDEITIVKERSDIDYLYNISIKDKQTDQIIYESSVWQYGGIIEEHEFMPIVKVDRSIFKKSGNYEIIIQPSIKSDIFQNEIEKHTTRHMLSITLEEENYTKKELFLYGFIIAFFIGLVFLIILYFSKKRNKLALAEKDQQKNVAKLQLNSIRSQLNPHFLFNALSGIQNLMNKNEIDNANKYLSKFARLTRNVLNDKELISLSQEKGLLDDYLQMERLRFGFDYEIKTEPNLDLDNVEIPSMLLQPFVENAVKHGISQKATGGKISILFIKQGNNLVLTVTDNGTGFDAEKRSNGLGIPLSESRIALLNSVYKENRFILEIQSSENGTKIILTLTYWL